MERWVAKVLSIVITFLLTLGCTLLPLKVNDYFIRKGKFGLKILSFLMCFGGGVFFAIFMLHMAPDVKAILEEALIKPNKIEYPLADLIISIGFFLMLFIEKLALKLNKPKKPKRDVPLHELENGLTIDVHITPAVPSSETDNANNAAKTNLEGQTDNSENFNGNLRSSPNTTIQSAKVPEVEVTPQSLLISQDATNTDCKQNDKVELDENHELLQGGHHHADLKGTRSLILLLALSLHHVFEGISIGLKMTISGVWSLSVAILSHEIIIGFSLGLQLVNSYKNNVKMVVGAAIMCSVMLPLGAIIGTILTEVANKSGDNTIDIVNGILQGIATGVFIYVTFFEILFEEFAHHDTSMLKLVALFLGFVAMALLGLIPEDKSREITMPMENNTCH